MTREAEQHISDTNTDTSRRQNAARERNCENASSFYKAPPAAPAFDGRYPPFRCVTHARRRAFAPAKGRLPTRDFARRSCRARATRARSRRRASRSTRAPRPRDLPFPFSQSQKSACLDCLPIPANKHRRAAHAKKPRRPPLFFAVRIRFWRTLPSAPISLQKSEMTCRARRETWERRRGNAGVRRGRGRARGARDRKQKRVSIQTRRLR